MLEVVAGFHGEALEALLRAAPVQPQALQGKVTALASISQPRKVSAAGPAFSGSTSTMVPLVLRCTRRFGCVASAADVPRNGNSRTSASCGVLAWRSLPATRA